MFSWIYWNPDPVAFFVPGTEFPIFKYGLLFVLGLLLGYWLLIPLLRRTLRGWNYTDPNLPIVVADRLVWCAVLGILIGARLGHALFYELDYFIQHPLSLFNTREGGLASHGGAIGVLIAFLLYYRRLHRQVPQMTVRKLLDLIVIPTALVATFIRIGNFFNQEIVGIITLKPWGIVFGDPANAAGVFPRHPVQLYEAFAYFATFILLLGLWWRRAEKLPDGLLTGLFFILVFGSRFFLEFYKVPQTAMYDANNFLQIGQILSIPFVLAGIFLVATASRKRRTA